LYFFTFEGYTSTLHLCATAGLNFYLLALLFTYIEVYFIQCGIKLCA